MCHGKEARRAAIFQRELCEGVLIGLQRYLKRTRRKGQGEHLYSEVIMRADPYLIAGLVEGMAETVYFAD